jgi:hypothetical protein
MDPFISGDLEINNEAYNNPAVMVSLSSALTNGIGDIERVSTFRMGHQWLQ